MALLWSQVLILICCVTSSNSEIIHIDADAPYMKFINIESKTSELIWIKGRQDAAIGLFQFSNTSSMVYEFIIGGWSNTLAAIRYKQHYPNPLEFTKHEPDLLLNPHQFMPFWVEWTSNNVCIKPGTVGSNGQAMQSTRFNDTTPIRYISFRTGMKYALKFAYDLSCKKPNISL
ncbi:hypothetical protein SNE40_010678 [Patella caerulea]|uniref:Farnesoic acid O-methyl transferase domain-containing protein n=1 Tax=Patella caerulea TaxID=87958 RepID=A0AAN8Q0J2_PATCE